MLHSQSAGVLEDCEYLRMSDGGKSLLVIYLKGNAHLLTAGSEEGSILQDRYFKSISFFSIDSFPFHSHGKKYIPKHG